MVKKTPFIFFAGRQSISKGLALFFQGAIFMVLLLQAPGTIGFPLFRYPEMLRPAEGFSIELLKAKLLRERI